MTGINVQFLSSSFNYLHWAFANCFLAYLPVNWVGVFSSTVDISSSSSALYTWLWPAAVIEVLDSVCLGVFLWQKCLLGACCALVVSGWYVVSVKVTHGFTCVARKIFRPRCNFPTTIPVEAYIFDWADPLLGMYTVDDHWRAGRWIYSSLRCSDFLWAAGFYAGK